MLLSLPGGENKQTKKNPKLQCNKLFKLYWWIFCVWVVLYMSSCMFVYHMHVWCSWSSDNGSGSPETGVKDGREAPCGYWELNSSPSPECQVLLTTEPPLQLLSMGLLNSHEFDKITLKSRKKRLNIFSFEQFYLFLLIQAKRWPSRSLDGCMNGPPNMATWRWAFMGSGQTSALGHSNDFGGVVFTVDHRVLKVSQGWQFYTNYTNSF